MSITPRNRISINEDLRKEQGRIEKKMATHKISLHVPAESIRKMKKKAIDEGLTLTDVFCQFVEEYIK